MCPVVSSAAPEVRHRVSLESRRKALEGEILGGEGHCGRVWLPSCSGSWELLAAT